MPQTWGHEPHDNQAKNEVTWHHWWVWLTYRVDAKWIRAGEHSRHNRIHGQVLAPGQDWRTEKRWHRRQSLWQIKKNHFNLVWNVLTSICSSQTWVGRSTLRWRYWGLCWSTRCKWPPCRWKTAPSAESDSVPQTSSSRSKAHTHIHTHLFIFKVKVVSSILILSVFRGELPRCCCS